MPLKCFIIYLFSDGHFYFGHFEMFIQAKGTSYLAFKNKKIF